MAICDCGTWTIQEGKIDFDRATPWIWFKRSSTIQERLLSGAVTDNFVTEIDVEIVDTDIDCVQAQADNLKTALQAIAPGSMLETTFCMAIFVNEHDDEYISKSVLNTDDGLHVASFSVRIFHRA